jgi:peroxiredoxin
MQRNSILAIILTLLLFAFPGLVAAVEVGDKAPDFELPSTKDGKFKLSNLTGKKNVIIQFYVLDFTPTWIKELSSSRDDYSKFEAVDAEILGVSANVGFSQKAFADYLKLNFPLLSDFPDLKTIQAYGVLNAERKLAQRSYFIVDKKGVIRYAKVLKQGEPLISNEALIEEVKKINKG